MSALRKLSLLLAAAVLPSCFFTCNSLPDYCTRTQACVCPGNNYQNCCVLPGGPCSAHDECCGGGTSSCVPTDAGSICSLPLRRNGTTCLPAESRCEVFADGGNDCCGLLCSAGICRCHVNEGGHCESKADCCYPDEYGVDNCSVSTLTCKPKDAPDGGA